MRAHVRASMCMCVLDGLTSQSCVCVLACVCAFVKLGENMQLNSPMNFD